MKKTTTIFLTFAAIFTLIQSPVQAQSWTSDALHSSMQFSVRHVMAPFVGRFDGYQVDVVLDDNDIKKASVTASIDPATVNSFSEGRDEHLKGEEFFDVATSPDHWTFISSSIKKTGEGEYIAKGKLTAKGVTKKIEIPFQFLGQMDTRWGPKAGITAKFTILRSEFGLGDDVGGLIGDEVTFMANLEMNARKSAE